jgi:hypothetical protein
MLWGVWGCNNAQKKPNKVEQKPAPKIEQNNIDTNKIIQNLIRQINKYYKAMDSCNITEMISYIPEKYIEKEGGYRKFCKKFLHDINLYNCQISDKQLSIFVSCGKTEGIILNKPSRLIILNDTIQTSVGGHEKIPDLKSLSDIVAINYICLSYNKGIDWKFIGYARAKGTNEIQNKFPELNINDKLEISKLKRLIFNLTIPRDYKEPKSKYFRNNDTVIMYEE